MSDLPGDSTATSDRAVTEPADQAAFRLEARAFLTEHAEPLAAIDPWQVSGFPDDQQARSYFERGRDWQRTLAAHGWAGLTWPSEFGGAGRPSWALSLIHI